LAYIKKNEAGPRKVQPHLIKFFELEMNPR